MSDTASGNGADSGGHLLRWLVLVVLAIVAVAAGRRVALDRADQEFEARLRQLDANRE